jgi:hypothetical protein
MTYRSIEKPTYDPGPCPDCGGTDVDVEWHHTPTFGNPDQHTPGWRTCLNESCGRIW